MVLETIVNGLAAVFDVFLWPLRTFFLPSVSLILIASALTVIVFVINRALVDKNAVKQIKDKVEETREKLTKAQKEGNKEARLLTLSDVRDPILRAYAAAVGRIDMTPASLVTGRICTPATAAAPAASYRKT